MKTNTIDLILLKEKVSKTAYSYTFCLHMDLDVKKLMKLTYALPEKKIEITESEFRKMADRYNGHVGYMIDELFKGKK